MEITVFVVTMNCCGEFEDVFGTEAGAEAWVKRQSDPKRYTIDPWPVILPSE